MESIKIQVKSGDSYVPLVIYADDTIESVKEKLKAKTKLLPADCSLFYKGNLLINKNTVGYYEIKDNAELEFLKKINKKIDIIMLGDSMVGKTSILKLFETEEYELVTQATIAVDFIAKKIRIGKEDIIARIWDTAGQERYFSLAKSIYNKCQGAFIIFDITRAESFARAEVWLHEIKKNADSSIIVYLIGNKIDLPNRKISTEEGDELASKYKIPYYETSAKAAKNVNETILRLATEICSKRDGIVDEDSITLISSLPKRKDKRSCC